MSEEILRALMQLFALLTKQDGGVEEKEETYVRNFLKSQLGESETEDYIELFREAADLNNNQSSREEKRTPVLDSVKILGICKKINKTLNHAQKIVVLLRLFELVGPEGKLTAQRLSIIKTVAEVFKIQEEDYESIRIFVLETENPDSPGNKNIVSLKDFRESHEQMDFLSAFENTNLRFLRIPGQDMYFFRYSGNENAFMNGLHIHSKRVYIFSKGSTIRLPHGKPLYYSDIASYFLKLKSDQELYFSAENISYQFSDHSFGLRDISFSAKHGNLIGILGSSGSGKTTLLNVLSGLLIPGKGKVTLNNCSVSSPDIQGMIGYVPQDDLLIEELTVFQNLNFNASLCFKDLSDSEIKEKTEFTLDRLGLLSQKGLKVGSPLNKLISGGQRKRLNIALELIREPSVLFLDEPTSGLSSRDSENVMDLLRELTLSGKLIFTVIHQPSSELFKMFDSVILLDEGGYMVYYGNPVEAVIYFKNLDDQINSQTGECAVCGNINPEQIFNILEAKVVDEYGNYTRKRKISSREWKEFYEEQRELTELREPAEKPKKKLQVPRWLKQVRVFISRDLLAKLGNRQYMLLTMLEAPLLGFTLAYIIRYIANPASNKYIFRENENIPIYIFMTLIVAVFLGLTISAEEIFRDRKILLRERFLQLSRSGYLVSKIIILFSISAIQALLFVLLANAVIELQNMNFVYWFAFFTTAACANLLGLNISSAFNSAVTIYIVIPLLIIPMMVLSGAMFSFEKLNRNISRLDKVPLLAEIMPTRWSYEALMVNQFKNNFFQVNFYDLDKNITNADFKLSYYLPELEKNLRELKTQLLAGHSLTGNNDKLLLLKNEFVSEGIQAPHLGIPGPEYFNYETFSPEKVSQLEDVIADLKIYYLEVFSRENNLKTNMVKNLLKNLKGTYYTYLDNFHNESVADHVRKIYERKKIVEFDNRLIRMVDPVYQDPVPNHFMDFRTHFFAPRKHWMGNYYETYSFNMAVIWILNLVLFISLYFDWLKKIIQLDIRRLFRKAGNLKVNFSGKYSNHLRRKP